VPVLEQYASGHWTRLSTVHLGTAHTYFALVTSQGDFALVLPGKASGSGVTTYLPLIFGGLVVLVLVVGGLLAIRLSRQRAAPEEGGSG
jgi:hypothetical protein